MRSSLAAALVALIAVLAAAGPASAQAPAGCTLRASAPTPGLPADPLDVSVNQILEGWVEGKAGMQCQPPRTGAGGPRWSVESFRVCLESWGSDSPAWGQRACETTRETVAFDGFVSARVTTPCTTHANWRTYGSATVRDQVTGQLTSYSHYSDPSLTACR